MSELKIDVSYYQHFSYLGFIDYCDKTDYFYPGKHDSSHNEEGGKNPWSGSNTYEEAEKYALHGWDSGLELIKSDDTIDIVGCIDVKYSVAGGHIDVSKYLSGVPDYMVNFTDETERNKPDLTIFVELAFNCGYTREDGINYCKEIINLVNKLQSKFNLRIIGMFSQSLSGKNKYTACSCLVTIKDYGEPVVLNSLIYAFHPAFFRRIWFKWLETKKFCESGYGYPLSNSGIKPVHEFLKPWLIENRIEENYILLPTIKEFKTNPKNFLKGIINKEILNLKYGELEEV